MTEIVDRTGQRYVGFLDVSGWQFAYAGAGRLRPGALPPNLAFARDRGIVGIIGRIGNGTSIDESFELVAGAAKQARIALGAYYYAQPNKIAASGAASLVDRWLAPFDLDLPVMLDLEKYHGPALSPTSLADWTRRWLHRTTALRPELGRALLYAGAAFVNPHTVAGSFAEFDTVQPRYPRQPTPPPSALHEWSTWIPWERDPRENDTLGPWNAWQFSSDATWSDFGGPPDAATNRLDVNVVPVETWNRWTARTGGRPAMHYEQLDHLPEPRFVDTRPGNDAYKLAADTVTRIALPGNVSSAGAVAAVINVTITQPEAGGYFHAWPEGDRPENASRLNFAAGQTIANEITVGLDGNGGFLVWSSARTHLLLDLVGIHR